MQATAFERAHKLMESQAGGAYTRAKAFGLLQAILLLSLFVVLSLLVVLLTTRGQGTVSRELLAAFPAVESRVTGSGTEGSVIDNAGLLPLVTANYDSPNLIHRDAARAVKAIVGFVPTLQNNLGALATLLAAALVIFVAMLGVFQARRAAAMTAGCETAADLRRQLHRQMYRLGQSSLPTEGTGPVANLFSREVNDVRDGLAAEAEVIWTVPVSIFGLFVIAILVSWTATLFLASLGALVWLAARRLQGVGETRSAIAARDLALNYYQLQEDLGMLRTVRVHGMENVDKERFDIHLQRHRDADLTRKIVDGQAGLSRVLLFGLGVTLALGILVHSVVVGGASPASALIVLGATLGLYPPVARWASMRKAVIQASRSAKAVFEYVDRAPELLQAVGAQFVPPLKHKITFENVTLTNAKGRTILDGFSAEFTAGTRTSIMSLDEEATHAIACLIPRLIDPKQGRVRFDGLDLREVTLESIRAQVACVLQADLVFSDTVFSNIALGDASYDLPRVIEAAKVAHAHQFIQELPQGYETLIGPMGTYLTTEQQFRIGLARAFLHDPSIVVIEEPNIALDDDLKHLLDDSIARIAAGRTLILLPHRLSTIRHSDQVVVIHNGKLDAAGDPRSLQAASKLFRHLQYVEFNPFATGGLEVGQMHD